MKLLLFLLCCLIIFCGIKFIMCMTKKESYVTKKKGICYFDIDDTLTTYQGNTDELMTECLKNNFELGIITASNRTLSDICDGNKGKYSWVSDILCKNLQKNKLFNSNFIIAGNHKFPSDYPHDENYGTKKGYAMIHSRNKYFPHISNKCLVLFDDNPDVLHNVHQYHPLLETQCANTTCGLTSSLTLNDVKQKLHDMKLNNC